MTLVGAIIGILIGALFSGLVIWIVGKLGWGLEVDGFGAAYIAAIIIAVVSWGIMWLMSVLGITIGGGFMGAIVHLLVAAVVLMISGNIVRGLRVKGFGGALVGAVALAVVGWLVGLLLGAFMPA
jgi:putative membrane protein